MNFKKTPAVAAMLLTALTLSVYSCKSGDNAAATSTPEADSLKAERMEWFADAKLGIFIHWGIYSKGDVSESWSFFNKRISLEDYLAQADSFTAASYDPSLWADLIEQSGAKYTVITSKHHDGFALWDTEAGDFSAVKSSAAGRDVLTPFVDEVRKRGLKLGLYYSLVDWPREDYPNVYREGPARYDIHEDTARWNHFHRFNLAQMDEINTKYHPDLIWFDGDWEQSAEDWRAPEIISFLRQDNPDVIINSRIQGHGDYATPEQGVPVVRPQDRWWETCMTMNDSWGYRKEDDNYKSPQTVIDMLVNCMSYGGNLLLDIGPKADGTIPAEQVALLKELGRWTSKHAEAIYGTRAGIPNEHVQAYTTLNKAGDILYIYFPYAPNESIELKGLKSKVKNVRVVGTDRTLDWKLYNDIDWSEVPGVYYIQVPSDVLDPRMTVLAVELEEPVKLYRGGGQVVSFNE